MKRGSAVAQRHVAQRRHLVVAELRQPLPQRAQSGEGRGVGAQGRLRRRGERLGAEARPGKRQLGAAAALDEHPQHPRHRDGRAVEVGAGGGEGAVEMQVRPQVGAGVEHVAVDLRRAQAAADLRLALEQQHPLAAPAEDRRGQQPAEPGSNDDDVMHGAISPQRPRRRTEVGRVPIDNGGGGLGVHRWPSVFICVSIWSLAGRREDKGERP